MVDSGQDNGQKEPAPQVQSNRLLVIGIVVLIAFFVLIFFLGPSIGLYLPCHSGIPSVPNATAPGV